MNQAIIRGLYSTEAYLSTAFRCLSRVSAASRIRSSDLALPGDTRSAEIGVAAYFVIGHDKRQKYPQLIDMYNDLTIELLGLMFDT